jgi:hypothetical protein
VSRIIRRKRAKKGCAFGARHAGEIGRAVTAARSACRGETLFGMLLQVLEGLTERRLPQRAQRSQRKALRPGCSLRPL